MEKAWFIAPNGESIMAPMEYTPIMVFSPNGKGMVL